jgi:hypothetical protein
MTIALHLRIAGAAMMVLAVAHVAIARVLRWRDDLTSVSSLTRQIFWVHTFFVCLTVFGIGAIDTFATDALLAPTPLARVVLAAFATFWGARLVVQHAVFDAAHWRGDRFRTFVHVAFTLTWIDFTLVHAIACAR